LGPAVAAAGKAKQQAGCQAAGFLSASALAIPGRGQLFQSHAILNSWSIPLPTLLQDLTQDSPTLTGWQGTHRSGEGKMIV
jgi:hypothetical protein